MKKLLIRLTLTALLLTVTTGLVGCETMEGAGRDIQSAGESIEDAAD